MIQACIPDHLASLIFVTIKINLKCVSSTLILLLKDDLVAVLINLEVLAHSNKFLVGLLHFKQIDQALIDFTSTVDHRMDLA